ncbi:MAG: hypothetical protein L0Z62_47215 [Gemmataceae bacterium]|nr:hypothetical protein [Gemmataceae bacterium]
MRFFDDPIPTLATQVRCGDREAVTELREELMPRLTPVVRQVLRTGSDSSPLDRRILRELARARRADGPHGRRLVGRVVRRLCALVIARLQRGAPRGPGAGIKETVRGL